MSLLQRYNYSKVISYFGYSKKEHPTLNLKKARNLKFAKTFGKMKRDVLFSYTLRLEISRTCGYDKVG